MKALFKINSIIAVLFCMATSLSIASTHDPFELIPAVPGANNVLSVTGEILGDGDFKTEINVFYFDESACTWEKYERHTTKSKYSIMLNPEIDYQIWYQTPDGHLKILYIDKGCSGVWDAEIDIDFENSAALFAHMYQIGKPDDPFFGKSLMRYHIEGADIPDSEEIVSNMEASCTATAKLE